MAENVRVGETTCFALQASSAAWMATVPFAIVTQYFFPHSSAILFSNSSVNGPRVRKSPARTLLTNLMSSFSTQWRVWLIIQSLCQAGSSCSCDTTQPLCQTLPSPLVRLDCHCIQILTAS